MTRKRVGQGLVEAFSETCEHCHGRGFIVHDEPIEKSNQRPDAGEQQAPSNGDAAGARSRRKRGGTAKEPVSHAPHAGVPVLPEAREAVKATLATIAAAAAHAHEHEHDHAPALGAPDQEAPVHEVTEVETEQAAPATARPRRLRGARRTRTRGRRRSGTTSSRRRRPSSSSSRRSRPTCSSPTTSPRPSRRGRLGRRARYEPLEGGRTTSPRPSRTTRPARVGRACQEPSQV